MVLAVEYICLPYRGLRSQEVKLSQLKRLKHPTHRASSSRVFSYLLVETSLKARYKMSRISRNKSAVVFIMCCAVSEIVLGIAKVPEGGGA